MLDLMHLPSASLSRFPRGIAKCTALDCARLLALRCPFRPTLWWSACPARPEPARPNRRTLCRALKASTSTISDASHAESRAARDEASPPVRDTSSNRDSRAPQHVVAACIVVEAPGPATAATARSPAFFPAGSCADRANRLGDEIGSPSTMRHCDPTTCCHPSETGNAPGIPRFT